MKVVDYYPKLIALRHHGVSEVPYPCVASTATEEYVDCLVDEAPQAVDYPSGGLPRGYLELQDVDHTRIWAGVVILPCPEGWIVFRGRRARKLWQRLRKHDPKSFKGKPSQIVD